MTMQDSLQINNLISQEIHHQLQQQASTSAHWANVWYCIQAIAIISLIIVGYIQLKKLIRANHLENYLDIQKTFNNVTFNQIYQDVISSNVIYDKENNCIKSGSATYSHSEFNRIFLNQFEDLEILRENDGVSPKLLDSGFGYMILPIGSNTAVHGYILHQRKVYYNDPSVFQGFITFYTRCYKSLPAGAKSKYIPPSKYLE